MTLMVYVIFVYHLTLTIDNESVPHYIVVENGIGVIKQMAEIETEDIYDTPGLEIGNRLLYALD